MEDKKIYYKLTDSEQRFIKQITKITLTDYEENGIMPISSFFSIAEDLLNEIYDLHDLIKEMKAEKETDEDLVEEMKIRELEEREE